MAINPEDVYPYVVRPTDEVKARLEELKTKDRRYQDLYDKLAGLLTTYPPHAGFFSIPIADLSGLSFVVKSEGGFLVIRAKYFPTYALCIVDKIFRADEVPEDLTKS